MTDATSTPDTHESTHVETLVIGFGKAGKSLAVQLAKAGRQVTLIEQSSRMYGGTCINIGCVPTKTLVHSADVRREAPSSPSPEEFYASAVERKETLREKMNAANLAMVETPGATVVTGRARFVGERTVEVTAGEDRLRITADNVVIGTGATPRLPSIEGLPENPLEDPRVVTSTELIDRTELPRRLAILGSGFIGLEFASMYSGFGSEVTVIGREDRLAPREDEAASEAIAELLEKQGVALKLGRTLESVSAGDDGGPLTLNLAGGDSAERVEADVLLISAGRIPATEGLGLAEAGVETDESGAVVVDSLLRTSAPGVWAVGDVKGGPQFTYVSFDDFRILKDQLLAGKGESGRTTEDRGPVPSTTFLTPPFSRVGLTEREARERAADEGWDVAVARKKVAELAAMPRPKALGQTDGFYQVVVDKTSGRILGATLFAVDSQEVINLVTMAMKHDLPYTALRDAIYTHPSSSEGLNELLAGI
ncbi:dihydrolipoyl dehydrogenase family protein [Falsarthrobacter nasiphocae]|uniref:Pyruvate/2-oxoglutarate dehydrogenase complex dihydrolipoamide dehydrogenase (E3) component n=1 Tax=Falsarthrobacter nasiphocae TaxID=189863 RepID=A0AAE3YJA7_9MICC|nr:FAD-dependent oxidoreductase [Falsarthrobacter nasiphocae]MDR6892756.1 pyruvate/2-oxoglutarate dehydrogenase complex dihydrolipoamide dehydrogenase (E3) component [Falsarthrobacter nasiphocae]